MKYIPLSEEELQVSALLPEGSYRYKVIKSDDKISQAGNEYISLVLKVWDEENREHVVFTNLSLIKLLKHFCDVNDMVDLYNTGEIEDYRCKDKSGGRVLIAIEGEKPDGKGGMYKAKNIVKDYIVAPERSLSTPLTPKNDFINDEIPF